ncbi:MAG TPA: hypothetical protein ENK62_09490 [Chromatiales bacterium]|nr:hypothetical protein [Chromatiales bacterium]
MPQRSRDSRRLGTAAERRGAPQLLAIVELGGYPDFGPLYRRLGFEVRVENSMRKALAWLKRHTPAVIVAEFNYQSGFRDRLSNLESLMGAVQRLAGSPRIVVFYEPETRHQLVRLQARFEFFEVLPYPIDAGKLEGALRRAVEDCAPEAGFH